MYELDFIFVTKLRQVWEREKRKDNYGKITPLSRIIKKLI